MQNRILVLSLLNFLMMPLIFFWQVLYCFFNYAELIKRKPSTLGVRKWSQYGRLYLRHLNELDHELNYRLNRAYEPANQYMDIFVSPMISVVARFFTFLAGSVLAVIISLSVWDEDVLYVEHVLTIITILGAIVAICQVYLPDENKVYCPEKTLTSVIAHIHYFPLDNWKGRAHTFEVMSHLNELFPYTALTLVEELVSPILTPFVLFFMLRPRASTIVDFFRNFTVDVTGVGDICSFAQMDVRRHGNPAWQQTAAQEDSEQPSPSVKAMTNAYTQAEAGKTEMSLINFTLANPGWKPPQESKEFINALRGQATREVEALPVLDEERLDNNPLYSSLTALENVGGVYTEIAQSLLASNATGNMAQVNLLGGSPRSQNRTDLCESSGSMMQSIRQGIANVSMMPQPPNLRQDLRRLGLLEYTAADMSLSALYLHELHQRTSSQVGPGVFGGGSGAVTGAGVQPMPVSLDYRLNDVSEEECVPLCDSDRV